MGITSAVWSLALSSESTPFTIIPSRHGIPGRVDPKGKTYSRRDSQMVTHSNTSRPIQCLCMAERTGCPVFTDLWPYVLLVVRSIPMSLALKPPGSRVWPIKMSRLCCFASYPSHTRGDIERLRLTSHVRSTMSLHASSDIALTLPCPASLRSTVISRPRFRYYMVAVMMI